MKNALCPHKLGLVIGGGLGLWHLVWSVLIALGGAQTFMDWVFEMHFIRPPYVVGAFHPWTAVMLIAVTAVFGYLIGLVFGWVWNLVHNC